MSSPDRRAHRNRRHRDVRAQVIPVSRLRRKPGGDKFSARPLQNLPELTLLEARRPKTRAGCADVPRPCPFVSCRYHLFLDVLDTGSLKLNFPDLNPWELPERQSCAIDIAEDGRVTLEELGRILNLTRERARQIELIAVNRFKRAARDVALDATLREDSSRPPAKRVTRRLRVAVGPDVLARKARKLARLERARAEEQIQLRIATKRHHLTIEAIDRQIAAVVEDIRTQSAEAG